jgi:hypothetical protein
MNDIEIHRTHPSKLNTKAPVVTLSLGEINQCNNESVTITLFPKLAEILARERALDLARRNQLDPPHAMRAENDAVQRAEAQEACVLRWNSAYGRYDLYHGAIRQHRTRFDAEGRASESSESRNSLQGILYLTISTPFNSTTSFPPRPSTIQITAPYQSHGQSSAEAETLLMELDLSTMDLWMSPSCILSIIPSLYTLDALIATILTVAVFDDASNIVLRSMDIRQPRPEDFPIPYRVGSPAPTLVSGQPNSNSLSPNGDNHPIPQAERQEAEQEAALMAQIRSQQRSKKQKSHSPRPRKWSCFGGKAVSEKRHHVRAKTLSTSSTRYSMSTYTSVQEIDLERYGWQGPPPVPAKDGSQDVPLRTRTAVKCVTWVFSAILAVATMIVKFILWIIVGLCVTSKKS